MDAPQRKQWANQQKSHQTDSRQPVLASGLRTRLTRIIKRDDVTTWVTSKRRRIFSWLKFESTRTYFSLAVREFRRVNSLSTGWCLDCELTYRTWFSRIRRVAYRILPAFFRRLKLANYCLSTVYSRSWQRGMLSLFLYLDTSLNILSVPSKTTTTPLLVLHYPYYVYCRGHPWESFALLREPSVHYCQCYGDPSSLRTELNTFHCILQQSKTLLSASVVHCLLPKMLDVVNTSLIVVLWAIESLSSVIPFTWSRGV